MPKNRYSIDLIKQMAECDANYIRLLRLMPVLAAHRQRDFASLGVDRAAQAEKALEGHAHGIHARRPRDRAGHR